MQPGGIRAGETTVSGATNNIVVSHVHHQFIRAQEYCIYMLLAQIAITHTHTDILFAELLVEMRYSCSLSINGIARVSVCVRGWQGVYFQVSRDTMLLCVVYDQLEYSDIENMS